MTDLGRPRARCGVLDLHGIGLSGAARLLGDIANIERFRTKAHFAS